MPRDRLALFVALSALVHAALAFAWADVATDRSIPPPNEAPVRVELLAAKPAPTPEPTPRPTPEVATPEPTPAAEETPPEPRPEREPPKPEPEPRKRAHAEPPAPEPESAPSPAPAPAAEPSPAAQALPQVAAAPLPAAEPGPPASPPTPSPEEIDAYIAEVRAWIDRHKAYPGMARRRGIEADVTIRLEIAPDGRVRQLATLGDPPGMFRSATEEAVGRAAPFPEPPAGFGTLEIGIRYRMER